MTHRTLWALIGLVLLFAGGLTGVLVDFGALKDTLACRGRYGLPEQLREPARPRGEPADFAEAVALNNQAVQLEWSDRSQVEEARELYRRAASMGLAVAEFNLANSYIQPGATREDYIEAASIHSRAADQGHPLAMMSLAQLLYRQDFGDLNRQLAAARSKNDQDASDRIFLLKRVDERLAISLMRKAAERGLPNAQYELAAMLRTLNREEEREAWLRRAAKQGHPYAQLEVSGYYAERKDYRTAARWLGKAAEAGVPQAQYSLATYYLKGLGVARDRAEAAYWFGRAAEKEPYVYPPDPRACLMPYLHSRRPSFTAPAVLNLRDRAAAELVKLRSETP